MALQDPNIMPSSRLDCPLSLKTPNMGNTGLTLICGGSAGRHSATNLAPVGESVVVGTHYDSGNEPEVRWQLVTDRTPYTVP